MLRTFVAAALRRAAPVSVMSLQRTALPTVARALSASAISEADELSTVLAQELEFEKSGAADQGAEALSHLSSAYEVSDVAGSSRLILRRETDAETVEIVVDVSDPEFLDMSPEGDVDDDSAIEPVEEDDEETEQGELVYYTTVSIIREEKKMVFECYVGGEAGLAIRNVHITSEDVDVDDLGADGTYTGPVFEELDIHVQEAFYGYLADRGIDDDFGAVLVEAAEAKDQKEYMTWLEDVKDFVEE